MIELNENIKSDYIKIFGCLLPGVVKTGPCGPTQQTASDRASLWCVWSCVASDHNDSTSFIPILISVNQPTVDLNWIDVTDRTKKLLLSWGWVSAPKIPTISRLFKYLQQYFLLWLRPIKVLLECIWVYNDAKSLINPRRIKDATVPRHYLIKIRRFDGRRNATAPLWWSEVNVKQLNTCLWAVNLKTRASHLWFSAVNRLCCQIPHSWTPATNWSKQINL